MSARCKCGSPVTDPAHCSEGHPQPFRPPVQVEQLADLVAERLAPRLMEALDDRLGLMSSRGDAPTLVDVHEIARLTGMSERWAYDHARQIGGVKLGDTKRARWRFDPNKALALLAERYGEPTPAATPRLERRELPGDAPLLPVRGRAA